MFMWPRPTGPKGPKIQASEMMATSRIALRRYRIDRQSIGWPDYQDVGSTENTRAKQRDSTLSWRELPVESPGHCQPAGNWIAFVCDSICTDIQLLTPMARIFPCSWSSRSVRAVSSTGTRGSGQWT
jgi:hypothetical protein